MDHPSTYEPDDDDDEALPEGVTQTQVYEKVQEIQEALSKLGLYSDSSVGVDVDGGKIYAFLSLDIGKLAFVNRVQDPKQDKVDQTFHKFETDSVRDRIEEIKGKFVAENPPDPQP